jgi:hypothetical protein
MFVGDTAFVINRDLYLPPLLQVSLLFTNKQRSWLFKRLSCHRLDYLGFVLLVLQHFLQLLFLDSDVTVFDPLLGSLILLFQ